MKLLLDVIKTRRHVTKKFQTRGVTFLHEEFYTGDVTIVSEGRVDDGIDTKDGRLVIKQTIPFLALKDFVADAVRKQLIEQIKQSDDDEILGVEELGDDETPLTDESDRDEDEG